jgi:hypothetical protein
MTQHCQHERWRVSYYLLIVWIHLCIKLWISMTNLNVHLRKLDMHQQSMT